MHIPDLDLIHDSNPHATTAGTGKWVTGKWVDVGTDGLPVPVSSLLDSHLNSDADTGKGKGKARELHLVGNDRVNKCSYINL